MNVIQFPITKNMKEKYITNDKLRIAYKLLDFMNDSGIDFHIVVNRETAEKVFELEGIHGYNVILTSNLEKAKNLGIKNPIYYTISGDEF